MDEPVDGVSGWKTGGNRRFSPRRFRETLLYVLNAFPEGLTEQQLSNIMFRIDMEAYRQLGRSITGATYIKMPWGAAPTKRSRKTTPDRRLRENRLSS